MPQQTSLWGRMSLAAKMHLAFGALLVLMAITGGIAYSGFSRAAAALTAVPPPRRSRRAPARSSARSTRSPASPRRTPPPPAG